MTVDIAKARALVEHERASFTRIPYAPVHPRLSRVELVDLIAALLDERDALMSLIRDEIDENTRLRVLGGAAADEGITAMIERVIAESGSFEALWRSTMDVLEAERAERAALARDAARLREGMLHFVEYGYNREVASALAAMKGASDE